MGVQTDSTVTAFDIMSRWDQISSPSLHPSVLFGSALTGSYCHSTTEQSSIHSCQLPFSPSLSNSLLFVLCSSPPPLYIPPSLSLSLSLHLHCISKHSPSPVQYLSSPPYLSLPLLLSPLSHRVITRSQASFFMTIIEARMLMPPDLSLPVSQEEVR